MRSLAWLPLASRPGRRFGARFKLTRTKKKTHDMDHGTNTETIPREGEKGSVDYAVAGRVVTKTPNGGHTLRSTLPIRGDGTREEGAEDRTLPGPGRSPRGLRDATGLRAWSEGGCRGVCLARALGCLGEERDTSQSVRCPRGDRAREAPERRGGGGGGDNFDAYNVTRPRLRGRTHS